MKKTTNYESSRIEREELEACPEYIALSKKEDALYNKLMAALPEELKHTLLEYSDTTDGIIALYAEFY